MANQTESILSELFGQWAGKPADTILTLAGSGSSREYFRLASGDTTVIGAYNADLKENLAFLHFTRHFRKEGLPVPEILAQGEGPYAYLLEDLGDITLFSYLGAKRKGEEVPVEIIALYREAIRELVRFQAVAGRTLDYSYCYPRPAFDRQSMMWDLNYFKYYFLKLAGIVFDEQALEDDFLKFTGFLEEAPSGYFLYRDFQSRNIMLKDGRPWFIDYQGGRRGALQYDLASLLYDAKADLPVHLREELYLHYLECLRELMPVDTIGFRQHYNGFVFIRIMQALGAYGFRGYYQKKDHFLKSIPYAAENLEWLLSEVGLPVALPELEKVLAAIASGFRPGEAKASPLLVTVRSFSFMKEIPSDTSGNGGGYVFDCRALPNPGRLEEYKSMTGQDAPVIRFLERSPEVRHFLDNVYSLVDQSVDNYLDRGFGRLMVSFGCTGGQHRSVYCAEQLAAHLHERYRIGIDLKHTCLPDDSNTCAS